MPENLVVAACICIPVFFALTLYSEIRKLTALVRDLMFQIDIVTAKIRAIQNNLKSNDPSGF